MGIVPDTRLGKLEFYEAHLSAWTLNAAGIGLQSSQLTALSGLVSAARAQFNAQQAAHAAAKSATESFYFKVSDMHQLGSDLIKSIKAYAATKNDPNVFVLAQIPAPAEPTPAGPPVTPTNLTAVMNSDGTILLQWKGSLAQRQFFSVWRQLPTQAVPVQIAAVAAKAFTDLTVPRGLSQVVYSVRAHRDTAVSTPTDNLVVFFGAVPGGSGFGAMVNGRVIGLLDPALDPTASPTPTATPSTTPSLRNAA